MTEKVLVTPAELSAMLPAEDIVLIDTRDPATYAAGHLPGAVNIHDIFTYLATSTPDGVAAMRDKLAASFGAAGLSGKETAVVYEQSMNSGFGQSCRGYVLLRYLGYPKVKILHGGYAAWNAAGMPTTTEVPTPKVSSFAIDPKAASILVDLQGMKVAVADPNVVKLDTRDVDEWIADSSSPYGKDYCPRKGRIPGAVWIEWYRMMKPTANGPMFKSAPEILAECASVGVTQDTPVVLYCFKGARASNTLVALKEPASRTSASISAPGTNGHAIRRCRSRRGFLLRPALLPSPRLEASTNRRAPGISGAPRNGDAAQNSGTGNASQEDGNVGPQSGHGRGDKRS